MTRNAKKNANTSLLIARAIALPVALTVTVAGCASLRNLRTRNEPLCEVRLMYVNQTRQISGWTEPGVPSEEWARSSGLVVDAHSCEEYATWLQSVNPSMFDNRRRSEAPVERTELFSAVQFTLVSQCQSRCEAGNAESYRRPSVTGTLGFPYSATDEGWRSNHYIRSYPVACYCEYTAAQ